MEVRTSKLALPPMIAGRPNGDARRAISAASGLARLEFLRIGTLPAGQLPRFRQLWCHSSGFGAETAAAMAFMLLSGFAYMHEHVAFDTDYTMPENNKLYTCRHDLWTSHKKVTISDGNRSRPHAPELLGSPAEHAWVPADGTCPRSQLHRRRHSVPLLFTYSAAKQTCHLMCWMNDIDTWMVLWTNVARAPITTATISTAIAFTTHPKPAADSSMM